MSIEIVGRWQYDGNTRASLVERPSSAILVDAFVYYNPCTEVWDASLRFNLSSHECIYGSFEGRRFTSRDAAKSWCERMVDINLPLLAEVRS